MRNITNRSCYGTTISSTAFTYVSFLDIKSSSCTLYQRESLCILAREASLMPQYTSGGHCDQKKGFPGRPLIWWTEGSRLENIRTTFNGNRPIFSQCEGTLSEIIIWAG